MKNKIYERDYRQSPTNPDKEEQKSFLELFFEDGDIERHSTPETQIIRGIDEQDKENYEYLLEQCDTFAQQHNGQVRGIIDYQKCHAKIEVILPFFEFCNECDLELLREVTEKANTVLFEPTKDGRIRLAVTILYFDVEIRDEDSVDQSSDKELMEKLADENSLSLSEEKAAQYLEELLIRFERETKYDRKAIKVALWERIRNEEADGRSPVIRMAGFAESLLEKLIGDAAK